MCVSKSITSNLTMPQNQTHFASILSVFWIGGIFLCCKTWKQISIVNVVFRKDR